jgi:hypothetical protein
VVAPPSAHLEIAGREPLLPEPGAADQRPRGDVPRLQVRLHPVQLQGTERAAQQQLHRLGHVAPTCVRRAHPVSEVRAPEAPVEDLREGEDPHDGAVLAPHGEEGPHRRKTTFPQKAPEGRWIRGWIDPRSVQCPARPREPDELGAVGRRRRPENQSLASGPAPGRLPGTAPDAGPGRARKGSGAGASAAGDAPDPRPFPPRHGPLPRRPRPAAVLPRPGAARRGPAPRLGPERLDGRASLPLRTGCNARGVDASAGADGGEGCPLHMWRRIQMPSRNDCRCEKKSCGCAVAEPCRCGPSCSCVEGCECPEGCSCRQAR